MSELRIKYEKLLADYKSKEKELIELQTNKKAALASLKKLEEEMKKIMKGTPLEELDDFLVRLDKDINTRLATLSETLSEYESQFTELKIGEASDDGATSIDNILEDI